TQVDEPNALRGPAKHAHLAKVHADGDPAAVDDHQLVILHHRFDRDQGAGLVGDLDRLHALAAAIGDAIVLHGAALSVALLADHQYLGIGDLLPAHGHHADHFILVIGEHHPAHAAGPAPHGAHAVLLEVDRLTCAARDNDVAGAIGELGLQQFVALADAHGNDAIGTRTAVGLQGGFLDHALLGDQHHEMVVQVFRGLEVGDVDIGQHFIPALQLYHVLDGPALALARAFRNVKDAHPVAAPFLGEDQQVVVVGGHEEVFQEILVARGASPASLAATALGAELRKGRALDVAQVADGDHHRFIGDEVLHAHVAAGMHDLRAALIAVLVADLQGLVLDDPIPQALVGQDLAQVGDQLHQLGMLVADLVALQAGEALQAHVQNGPGLQFAQPECAHEPLAGDVRCLAGADQGDHFVQVIQCNEQALQDVRAFLGLPQIELGAAHHHIVPVLHEMLDHGLQPQEHGAPAHQRNVVHAEAGLQRTELVQLVEHHGTHGLPLHVIRQADAIAVAVVVHITDALDPLLVHQVGHALVELHRLVHLEGDLADDDRLPAGLRVFLNVTFAAQHDPSASGLIGLPHAIGAVDDASRGEVRAFDVLHEPGHIDVVVLDVGHNAVADLREVVRRHVGGHAHGDTGAPVHQQVGDTRGHHARLLQRVIEVGPHVHRLLVQVGHHLLGDL